MIINDNKKEIIITKNSPVREIYFNDKLSYMWRKNDTDRIDVELGDISKYLDYIIKFERIYLVKDNIKYQIYDNNKNWRIQDLIYNKIHTITFNCLEPNIEVEILAKKLNLTNISMAEIGFKFLVTTKYLLSTLDIISYDLYDIDNFVCENARNYFKNNHNINIYEGYANEMLTKNNHIYDYVFYDCTHRYYSDSIIIKELIPHLTKDSVIIFHDYTMPECHQLIDEFGSKHICKTYAINNINALDKARGDIIKIWDPSSNFEKIDIIKN